MARSVLILLSFLLCLSSCAPLRAEPERISVVSAIGFDGGAQLRVFLEIALAEGESGEGLQIAVLTGEGNDVKEALRSVSLGSQKQLEFSHCALLVLGDSLTEAQLEEVFRFAGMGEQIPLEASVVSAAEAKALLTKEETGVAVGYGVPQLLLQLRNNEGVELKQTVYGLRSAPDPLGVAVLPRLRVGEDERPAVFEGLQILRRGGEAVTLSELALLPYALLSDRFCGVRDASAVDEGQPKRASVALMAELDAEGLSISLRVEGKTEATEEDCALLSEALREQMTDLFAQMQLKGVDPFAIGLRLQRSAPHVWEGVQEDYQSYFAKARLRVSFVWNGGSET